MTCPRCGGIEREMLAPGYYRCLSTVEVMGYIPAPGMHAGPVPLVPGPERRTCGHAYQEGSANADLGFCDCGTAAVARCVDCDRPLCGIDLVRRGGQVLCADDARSRAQEAETERLRAALDRVSRSVAAHHDPTERAFLLYLAKNAVPGAERVEDKELVRDTLRSLVPDPGPALAYSPDGESIRLSSPAALAAWAFAHPNAPAPVVLPVVKIVQYMEWLKLPRGRIRALCIAKESYEAPTGDFQIGRTEPPAYLLEDGTIVSAYNGYLEAGRHSPSRVGWDALARTLKLT
jgi:hypothetical protein